MNDTEVQVAVRRRNMRFRFAWLSRFLSRRQSGSHNRNSVAPSQDHTGSDSLYFGTPVSNIYAKQELLSHNIPIPLYHTTQALQGWLDTEGIFRISGIFSEMNSLKATFEKGTVPDFDAVESKHSISGLLEMWFRELPEPITTHALYDEFMNCIAEDGISEEEISSRLEETIRRLPPFNQQVLAFFLQFMNDISSYEGDNKMGAKNLGVVFGSILLGSAVFSFSLAMKQKLEQQSQIVQLMIQNVHTYFPEDQFPYPFDFKSGSSSD